MPSFTPTATLTTKSKEVPVEEQIIEYSGFLNFDVDDLHKAEKAALLKKLKKDRFISAVWESVSGEGITGLIEVEGGAEMHLENFYNVEAYFLQKYKVEVDKSCKNINRLRYLSSSKVHFNDYAGVFTYEREEELQRRETTISTATPKQVSEDVAFVLEQIKATSCDLTKDSYNRWLQIGLALIDQSGEEARDTFHFVSSYSTKYDFKKAEEQFNTLLQYHSSEKGVKSTIKTFFFYAKEAGLDISKGQLLEAGASGMLPKKERLLLKVLN